MRKTHDKWKICSRGHKYQGSGPCPICWPGHKKGTMTIIDEYLKKIDPTKRKQLARIRTIAKKVVPDAEETISYGMPTLKYKGKSFLGFNVYTNHIGIYPYGGEEIAVFKDKLSAYGLSSGAIRVPYDEPIPEILLKEIITHRIKRIE